jgi:NAD(P)-dependent dehydrogenase (short-subunit alcohol dehydrogenase family)
MDLALTDRVAVVTGGSQGIGKAVARGLALEGCDVALVARTRAKLEATAAELAQESGRTVVAAPADTSVREQVDAMVADVVARFGRIDVLVNCAGTPGGVAMGGIETIADEDQLGDLNTKYMGYLRTARAVAPHMKERGFGRIVHVGGLSGRTSTTYAGARNTAIAHLSKALSDELGPFGITSNVIHPGLTNAGDWFHERLAQQAEERGSTPEEVEREWAQGNAIRRIVGGHEVADVVAFLASPRSVAITGETFAVGGGSQRTVTI